MVCGGCFGGCLLLAVLAAPKCFSLGEFLRGGTPLNALFFHIFSGMGKDMVPLITNNDPKCTNPHRAVEFTKFDAERTWQIYRPMRVQSFLIIDGLVSCTHSFPMLEKNGEKRALKEGYAPSLRILLQVGAGSTDGPRKETPAEAIGAHLFWRIRGCLFDVSSPRRRTSEVCFGLRFLPLIERL